MRYGSLCSGIEAATSAWHHLGWEPAFFSEIEAFPCAVLAHHYPTVPNYGDMTKFKEWPYESIDILVGGTPCQSFSVAGLRKGLDDPRGNLALTYLAIADRYRPKWLVWENVPGVLSSNGGRDFGSFLGGLGQLGYGFAYRVLDAQHYGVAQRRRRVFVVGHLGNWQRAAAVLFERESLSGHPAPSRGQGKTIAACLGASPASSSSPNVGNGQGNVVSVDILNHSVSEIAHTLSARNDAQTGSIFKWPAEIASTLNAEFGDKQGLEDQHALNGALLFVPAIAGALTAKGPGGMGAPEVDANHYLPVIMSSGQSGNVVTIDKSSALTCLHEAPIVAQPVAFTTEQTPKFSSDAALTLTKQSPSGGGQPQCVMQPMAFPWQSALDPIGKPSGVSGTLIKNQTMAVQTAMQVRRLTLVECERLQGFPDDHTNIPYRNKATSPDGPRYKALGNSMAVPVMRWIGERIQMVEGIK